MGEGGGCYITLFSPSDVTAFHRSRPIPKKTCQVGRRSRGWFIIYVHCRLLFLILETVHAMVLLMCHTHYTVTQPETLGLIDNTLLNKNLKTNVMDVHCILNAIFNGKQTRRASSMLTKIGVKQTIRARTSTDLY